VKAGDLVKYCDTYTEFGVVTLVAPGGTHPWAEVAWNFGGTFQRREDLIEDLEVINESR